MAAPQMAAVQKASKTDIFYTEYGIGMVFSASMLAGMLISL